MSDTPSREGSRLGPYLLGRRHPDSDPDLGHIYEAHHIETGVPALVLVPDASSDWAPRAAWTVRSRSEVSPPFIAMEVECTPEASTRALHELTLLYIRMSGTMAGVEDREDMAAFLSSPSRAPRSPSRSRALPLSLAALVGLLLGLGMMWLGSRVTGRAQVKIATVSEEIVDWVDVKAAPLSTIAYPLPSAPLQGQHKPPCVEGTEEINGGCWARLDKRAPCVRGTAEYQGRCYMAVREPPPEPRSVGP